MEPLQEVGGWVLEVVQTILCLSGCHIDREAEQDAREETDMLQYDQNSTMCALGS